MKRKRTLSFYFVIRQGREGVVRESAAHTWNQLHWTKQRGLWERDLFLRRRRPSFTAVEYCFIVLSTSKKKFIDVLLSSLSYSSRQNLHVAKCEVSPFVTVFSVFPALFSAWMKARPPLKAKAPTRKSRQLLLFMMRMTLVKTPHQPCFQ